MSNQHQLPEKLITFINALQSTSRIGVSNVSYNNKESYVTDYFITWAGQQWNIWHNKNEDTWGWKPMGVAGFSHVFTQGFDEDSI